MKPRKLVYGGNKKDENVKKIYIAGKNLFV